MIVADANLILYLLLESPMTASARAVHEKDGDWVAPELWQSEVLNGLLRQVRAGYLSLQQALLVADHATALLEGQTRPCSQRLVLQIAHDCGLTAYDATYVALARTLNAKLVTEDRKIHQACPDAALAIQDFLNLPGKEPGLLKERKAAYRTRKRVRKA